MSKEIQERAQYLLHRNPFAIHNHVNVTDTTETYCEGYLDVEDDVTNVYGMPHGGAYFALADVLAGMVLRASDRQFVTQSASVHFLRTTKEPRLFGRAEFLKLGRGTAAVEAKVTDSQGKLLFFATFDFFNVEGRVKVREEESKG